MFKPGVGFHYNVSNWESTLAFYTEKLGFKLLYCDKNEGQAMVTTNTKDCFIGFAQAQSIIPSSTCTTFEVENIEQAVQTLQKKGVEFPFTLDDAPSFVCCQ